jgi:hypothetical protein
MVGARAIMRLNRYAFTRGRTIIDKMKNKYFHPLLSLWTSQAVSGDGSCVGDGHECEGTTMIATSAATTEPIEKN